MSFKLEFLVPGALLFMTAACSHEQKSPGVAGVFAVPARVPLAKPPPTITSTARPAPAVAATSNKGAWSSSIFFDFDSAQLREEAHPVLQKVASSVWGKNDVRLRVEGNCDDLGTVEYNLALGEHRALAAKDYLGHLGVQPERITTVSYGSQRQKYPGADEADRRKNRRDDFVVTR